MSAKLHQEKQKAVPFIPASWKPTYFRYEGSDQGLTPAAGMGPIVDLFFEDCLFQSFRKILPGRLSNASFHPETFAMTTICSAIYGHDCIDDIEEFQHDPGVKVKLGGEIPSVRAMGDYYRAFEASHIDATSEFMRSQARAYRSRLHPKKPLVIDMDSTAHVQRGLLMEGVEFNYKNQWCLDSLMAWDELGFCHGMELRRGNTFSSQGAPKLIAKVFSHLKNQELKYFRADSAFHNKKVIQALLLAGARFTITAHGRSNWIDKVLAGGVTHWVPWVFTEEEKKRAEKTGKKLPTVDVGSMLYKPGWSPNIRFYVVVKRTLVTDKKSGEERWKYYGVITNWNLFRNKAQSVIEFHNGRSNSENYIKEGKWNYDLLHFPMQKIRANHAYGLLFLIAHNLIRALSLLDYEAVNSEPEQAESEPGPIVKKGRVKKRRVPPMFAKKFRRKFVFIPGKLIRKSGRRMMKMPKHKEREVQAMMTAWRATLQPLLARAG